MTSFTAFDGKNNIQYAFDASEILNKDFWRCVTGFRYYLDAEKRDEWVDIPAGYLTDGASVPKLFHNVVQPWGRHGPAVVVHDILCEYLTVSKRVISDGVESVGVRRITRKECDQILLNAMKVLKVPKWRYTVMYWGVSLFRRAANVRDPSLSIIKLRLEKDWRRKQGQPEPEVMSLYL